MSKARQLADLGGDTANLEDISSVLSSGQLGNRNLIINGAMAIDQRSSGSYVTVNGGGIYTLDRWRGYDTTDGVFTVQRVADAPDGFINSAKITVTTADASITTNQQSKFQQRIEGYNAASLALGTSGAKTFTLSFWVKSSVTGTFAVGFMNTDSNRSYVDTYTINSANTWEYKTITLTGDTTGTWRVDNITGLNIQWSLGMGPSYEGTVGSWQAGEYSHASGAVNLLSTLNATWQITGVQLEVGDTATPFEHRSYGQELALCQRYYAEVYAYLMGPTNASDWQLSYQHPVEMRAVPSRSLKSGFAVDGGGSGVIVDHGKLNFSFRNNVWGRNWAGTFILDAEL